MTIDRALDRLRSADTPRAVQLMQVVAWRNMSPGERVARAMEMSDELREVAISGACARQGHLDTDMATREVCAAMYGRPLTDAAWGRR